MKIEGRYGVVIKLWLKRGSWKRWSKIVKCFHKNQSHRSTPGVFLPVIPFLATLLHYIFIEME